MPSCKVSDRDLAKFAVAEGDIVVARTGATVGYAKFIGRLPGPTVFASYLVRFRVRDDVDPRYVGYVVESDAYKRFIRANAGGAAQPNANARTLGSYPVPLPDLPIQRRVSAILACFDEIAEMNATRSELVKNLARSLYREWFVRFRFPGHERVDLVDSVLGPIPQDWGVGRLDDHLRLARGFDLPVAQRSDGEIPVVSASGVTGAHSVAKVRGPGVATGRSGTIGRVIYIGSDFWPLNTTLWVQDFRLATPRSAYFLLESLRLQTLSGGAAVPTLNRNHVHGLPVVTPPHELIVAFDDVVAPMFDYLDALEAATRACRRTRDLLLPRLVTGRLDASQVDVDSLLSMGEA